MFINKSYYNDSRIQIAKKSVTTSYSLCLPRGIRQGSRHPLFRVGARGKDAQRLVGVPQLRQYLYFCTSKASKLRTSEEQSDMGQPCADVENGHPPA